MYLPQIASARPVRQYVIGPYTATLLTDCVSIGHIEYAHILAVYPAPKDEESGTRVPPILAVASETSLLAKEQQQYFLCAFQAGSHLNYGADPKWFDLKTFETRALALAGELLKTEAVPYLVRQFETDAGM